MKKVSLLKTMLLLCALVAGSSSVWAAETAKVTFDFTSNTDWGFPSGSSNKTAAENTYTANDYTITLKGSSGNGYYWNSGYLLIGKTGAYIQFPAFTFNMSKIVVTYSSGVSTSNKQNIYVGESTVSTEVTASQGGTGTFNIASASQAAGTIYKLQITTNNNCQITKIEFFEKKETHTLSSAVSPVGAGTVSLGATSVDEGSTTTISATANAGYVFESWSVDGTGASVTDASAASTTFTMGTANATVTANFTAVTTHEIKWSVNGSIIKTENIAEGSALSFAAPASGIPAGFVFKGWVVEANKINTPTDTDPSANYITSATSTADITYYAVMAAQIGSEPSTLTKMVKGNTFSAGDKIVIVAQSGEQYYALYQETTNSSYVKYYTFTESAASVAMNDKNWLTVSAGTGDKWKLGDATNGYLYSSSSNNLSVVTNNASEWTLVDNNDGTFSLTQGRYLSCRSDLSGDNQYLYRLAGSTPAGVYKLTLYKYVLGDPIYASYCTTAPTTATITIAESGYSSLAKAIGLDFANATTTTDGAAALEAYIVPSITASSVSLSAVTEAPAATGIILKGTAGATYTIPVKADAAAVGTNYLKAAVMAYDCAANEVYILKNGKLCNVTAASTVPAGKAYLLASDVPVSSAPEFLGFIFDDMQTTGVNDVRSKTADVRGDFFDLQGRKVANPKKGLYIVNGKKVAIK